VRKISEDMIPRWAGNERKTPKGSKPRRKRKLSEGAIEEQKLEDEARKQASLLLTPKSNKAMRRRKRKERRRSRSESMGEPAQRWEGPSSSGLTERVRSVQAASSQRRTILRAATRRRSSRKRNTMTAIMRRRRRRSRQP
jgi:hypothetical protein